VIRSSSSNTFIIITGMVTEIASAANADQKVRNLVSTLPKTW
jgi:hypothetical protein